MNSLNGSAPPQVRGAVALPANRTIFLPELPPTGFSGVAYALAHFRLAGLALDRWLWSAGGALALLLAARGYLLPGVALLIAVTLLQGVLTWRRRSGGVEFRPADWTPSNEQDSPPMAALAPETKIPVYATGLFGVEKRRQPFSMLPGFFRTFATREHALLCKINQQRFWRWASWPEEELGLWYIFFHPAEIATITTGALAFGQFTGPALAIAVQQTATGQRQPPAPALILLAFCDEAAARTVLRDLLADRPELAPATNNAPSPGQAARQTTSPPTSPPSNPMDPT
jgi:hypothetical protein